MIVALSAVLFFLIGRMESGMRGRLRSCPCLTFPGAWSMTCSVVYDPRRPTVAPGPPGRPGTPLLAGLVARPTAEEAGLFLPPYAALPVAELAGDPATRMPGFDQRGHLVREAARGSHFGQ